MAFANLTSRALGGGAADRFARVFGKLGLIFDPPRPQHDAHLEPEHGGESYERREFRIAAAIEKVSEPVTRQTSAIRTLLERQPVRALPRSEVAGHRGEPAVEPRGKSRMIAERIDPLAVPGATAR